MTDHWHPIRFYGGMALHGAARLMENGVKTYVPMKYSREKIGRQVKIVSEIRLPGHYGFVWLRDTGSRRDLIDQAGFVKSIRGVEHVFSENDGYPLKVRPDEIRYFENLEAQEKSQAMKPPSRAKLPRFEPGHWVKVVRHELFAGREGEVMTCLRGVARVVIGDIIVSLMDCDIEQAQRPQSRNAAA